MDVRCGRCATDYEFDDALISERGTTVKCTNCGYQFKVFPNPARATIPERWIVKDATGKQTIFTTLRDLQRGIAEGRVGPLDVLSRGQEPPRTLSSIAELDHLFKMYRGPQQRVKQTLHGLAPDPIAAVTQSMDEGRTSVEEQSAEEQSQVRHVADSTNRSLAGPAFNEEPDPFSETLIAERETVRTSPPPPAPSESSQVFEAQGLRSEQEISELERAAGKVLSEPREPVLYGVEDMPTVPGYSLEEALRHERTAGLSEPQAAATPPPPPPLGQPASDTGSRPDPQPQATSQPHQPAAFARSVEQPGRVSQTRYEPPVEQEASFDHDLEPPRPRLADIAGMYEDLEDPYYEAGAGRRATVRWIVALVLLGAVVLFALTTGRQYFERLKRPASSAQRGDDQVVELVRLGTSRLEQGDLEAAQRELTKAQALAETDPGVLSALARLEVTFADQLWLKLRLLDSESQREVYETTQRALKTRTERAQRAVDRAVRSAPDREDVRRSRINLLRIKGEIDRARRWIGPIGESGSKPDNAYVLGALDLAEEAPVWSSVVDRLTTASATERQLGRSRALLIYALVRAKRPAQAQAELDKLTSLNPKHPLLSELGGFVSRHVSADAGVDAGPDANPASSAASDELAATTAEDDLPSAAADFRGKLEAAGRALERGDLSRAEMLYRAVLREQPRNVEALAGVADVARARQDHGTASKIYDEVLDENPSYLPALMASADQKWSSGDRKGALALYRQVLDQAGANSAYGMRALSRIEQASREGAEASPSQTEPSPQPQEPEPSREPKPSQPRIDTSDLPEYFE